MESTEANVWKAAYAGALPLVRTLVEQDPRRATAVDEVRRLPAPSAIPADPDERADVLAARGGRERGNRTDAARSTGRRRAEAPR